MKNWLPFLWCAATLLATTIPGNVYSSSLSGAGKSTRYSIVPIVNVTGIPSSVNEGDATIPGQAPTECIKYSEYTITVNMTEASTQPVKVSMFQSFYYQDDYPMATEGADFEILPAEVTFAPGDLSKEFTIRIFDDAEEDTDEVLTLDFSIETNGDAEPDFGGFHNITIIDNDGASENVETTIISETFPTITPTDWTFVPSVSGVAQWQVNSGADGFETNYLYFQYLGSDVGPYPAVEETVETPSFDASDYSAVRLSFDERLRLDEERITGRAFVDVWTGTDWVNVQELYSAGSDAVPFHVDLSIGGEYVNQNMKLRFRCIGYTSANWLIDNVKIIGVTYSKEIATETTLTPDQKYLGPNATAYFYDPATNAILAKIKNLTSHNYGCTSVEIDRAGDGTSEWQGGYNITNKTLKVTPSNPNPAGSYEITLYYTSAELADFQDNVTSMGKSEGGIALGDESQAVPVTVTRYNGDYAFTATFDTGFSGFGLSDAPPGTSLPVKILSFEGQRSSEGNVLHWVTSTETNNDYFAVERSFDAKRFSVSIST